MAALERSCESKKENQTAGEGVKEEEKKFETDPEKTVSLGAWVKPNRKKALRIDVLEMNEFVLKSHARVYSDVKRRKNLPLIHDFWESAVDFNDIDDEIGFNMAEDICHLKYWESANAIGIQVKDEKVWKLWQSRKGTGSYPGFFGANSKRILHQEMGSFVLETGVKFDHNLHRAFASPMNFSLTVYKGVRLNRRQMIFLVDKHLAKKVIKRGWIIVADEEDCHCFSKAVKPADRDIKKLNSVNFKSAERCGCEGLVQTNENLQNFWLLTDITLSLNNTYDDWCHCDDSEYY